MNKVPTPYANLKPTKLLWAISLFLGLIAGSGFVQANGAYELKPTQTELVATQYQKRETASFRKIRNNSKLGQYYSSQWKENIRLCLSLYQGRINTNISNHQRELEAHQKSINFLSVKYSPRNLKEVFSNSVRG